MATLDTVKSYTPTFLGLGTQLGISASISLYCILQFEWNRRKKSMQYLYTPRTKLKENPSPQIPSGLFSWVKATIFLKDEFYLNKVGLDALMYIRFLRMAFQFVLFNVIVVGSILIPINYTSGSGDQEEGVSRLSLSNIKNENTEILWAHVVCTYIVSISWMYLLYKNYYDYMILNREHLMKKVLSGSITERTVMISRIPRELRSEDKLHSFVSKLGLGEVESARMVRLTGKLDRKISRREKTLLSLERAHIKLAKNVCNAIKRRRFLGTGIWARFFGYSSDLQTLNLEAGEAREHPRIQSLVEWLDPRKKRRTNTSEAISENGENTTKHFKLPTSGTFASDDLMVREDGYGRPFLIWNALRNIPKEILDKYQPTYRTGLFGRFGKKVISIDSLLKKFNYLDRRIAELRSKSIQEPPYKATSTGFVTFKDHISAQLCAQSIMNSKPHTCTTKMAPEPRDILWDNLTMKFREKLIRYIFINACVWALTVFWLFPIGVFLTLTSIDSLSKKIKFLDALLNATPIIRTLLQNVLPTVLVTSFMAILPWILMELSKQESFSSYSELEEAVLIRYYHFSFFNVFLVFLLGYTFLQSIYDVIQQPTSILETIANKFPKGATFFINYIVFNICTHGLELVQVGSQLFLHIILTSRFISTTPRMLQRVTHPWSFQFYYYYPNHILVLVITITYSVINPLILVFSVLYYGFALIVFKHQFAYCYVRRYEAGGKFYRRVFRYTTDGLIIFQLTIIGMIWLRKAVVVGAMLVPLLVGTGYFKYYCHKTFYSRTHYLALDSRLLLPNNTRDEQDDQRVSINENGQIAGEKVVTNSPETSHNEKENIESDARIKGKAIMIAGSSMNVTNNQEVDIGISVIFEKKDGFRELERNNSTGSETSTKIASSKNNGITKDTVESDTNDSQNDEDIHNKKSQGFIDKIKLFAEKSLNSSSEKLNNIQKKQDEEGADVNGIIYPPSVIAGASAASLNNLPTKSMDNTNNDNSSSKAQKKVKGNNLTIVLPEDGNSLLNMPITASPVENIHGHALRLPSGGNLRRFHPAHFTHDPNFKVLQDETSQYQTYTHPNLVKALNRKLWLPRNPLKKICLDDNVELSRALTSSEGGSGTVGYWGGASQYLGEARVSIYGNHEFPSVHVRAATNEEDQNALHARRYTDDKPCDEAIQNNDCEGGEELDFSFNDPEEHIDQIISGEFASGELTSGEEF